MARYTGPVCRLCRRRGEKLFLKGERCFTPKCAVEKKSAPPGVHFARRRRLSERAIQLREKQKARATYGILERQFKKYFQEAQRKPGVTGQYLLQLLERRLDNVVYRLGMADSRRQARQIVRHGHFIVNGKRTDVPSFLVRPGDEISVREGSKGTEYFTRLKDKLGGVTPPQWLSLDTEHMAGKVMAAPDPADLQLTLDPRYIVEFYSR